MGEPAREGDTKPRQHGQAKVYEIYNPRELFAVLKRLKESRFLFVYFVATIDLKTGRTWCPDTFYADPVVMRVFKSLPFPSCLIRVHVGGRRAWHNPSNPFRTEPFDVWSVPTLARWEKGELSEEKLIEKDAMDAGLVRTFVEGKK